MELKFFKEPLTRYVAISKKEKGLMTILVPGHKSHIQYNLFIF